MFDLSKLRKPDLLKDYDLSTKINDYITKAKEALPEWSAAAADPMTKILKALAAMDCLRVQRTNETARRLLVAFAEGADLDNLRPDIERMRGSNPIAKLKITYRNPDSVSGIIQAGTEFRGDYTDPETEGITVGYFKAKTYLEYEIEPDPDNHTQIIEAVIYEGGGENTDKIKIDRLLIASPIIEKVEIDEIEAAGADEIESDERYRQRILLAPTSNMGGKRAYQYYAMSADLRIQEVYIETTAPGCLTIWVLPNLDTWKLNESEKSARIAELETEVTAACSDENNCPCADIVTVEIGNDCTDPGEGIGNVIRYKLNIKPHLLPGTSQEVLIDVKEKAKAAVKELYGFGRDISKNIISGMCYVHGISGFEITIEQVGEDGGEVDHIACGKSEAAYCFEDDIVINAHVFDGGID